MKKTVISLGVLIAICACLLYSCDSDLVFGDRISYTIPIGNGQACDDKEKKITRLIRNESVSTHTIDVFCRILNCDVGDIMRYIPDEL